LLADKNDGKYLLIAPFFNRFQGRDGCFFALRQRWFQNLPQLWCDDGDSSERVV